MYSLPTFQATTVAADDKPLDFAALNLTANLPEWTRDPGAMARFQRAAADVWVPLPAAQQNTLCGEDKRCRYDRAVWRSQSGEDAHAYERYFYGRGGGTFLEMGALDGKTYSNSHAFETALGWRGVHVEASPPQYTDLVRNRPDQVAVHVAMCGRAQTVHYTVRGNKCCNGIPEFMSPAFLAKWHPELPAGNFSSLPEVPCVPLGMLLGWLGMQHINLYVLDVEGGELMVLQSVDFSQLSFDVIAVEADGSNPEKDRAVIDLLVSKGYTHDNGTTRRNDWFSRKGFQPSQKPAVI